MPNIWRLAQFISHPRPNRMIPYRRQVYQVYPNRSSTITRILNTSHPTLFKRHDRHDTHNLVPSKIGYRVINNRGRSKFNNFNNHGISLTYMVTKSIEGPSSGRFTPNNFSNSVLIERPLQDSRRHAGQYAHIFLRKPRS